MNHLIIIAYSVRHFLLLIFPVFCISIVLFPVFSLRPIVLWWSLLSLLFILCICIQQFSFFLFSSDFSLNYLWFHLISYYPVNEWPFLISLCFTIFTLNCFPFNICFSFPFFDFSHLSPFCSVFPFPYFRLYWVLCFLVCILLTCAFFSFRLRLCWWFISVSSYLWPPFY